jgi:glucokinase
MDNDANAAALGEWYFGAGKRVENMIYIQVSTGVGAGLILNGQLFRGNALAGEFGHITILPDGPICVCGRPGCVESMCSGWAIARDGRAAFEVSAVNSPLHQLCNNLADQISAQTVIEAYRQGDLLAQAILEKAFTGLAIGISNMVSLFDPDSVVLGGGVTRAQDVLLQFLNPALEKYLHPLSKNRFALKFSELNGMETLLGAALLS